MKKYIITLCLIVNSVLFAQNPEIKSDLPNILPPSPTVAALMKFEEVPVSNYTGIPDISIPLFSSPTNSKDINLDISLKYHPGGIAADEKASDVGLGWSLFAGGTVSRTVRGFPDELFKTGTNIKVGLYQNSIPNYQNNYYNILNLCNGIDNELPVSNSEFNAVDEYLWDSQVRGILDTEHDLWQFNFMGFSGRFYIKKNAVNQLEVTPLDDYRLKIINNYGDSSNTFKPTGFTIYDEKGYKYVFDVVEITTTRSVTFTTPSIPDSQGNLNDSSNIGATFTYNSSFHLSKIYNTNNEEVIDFVYNSNKIKERVIDGTVTMYNEDYQKNIYSVRDYQLRNPCGVTVKNFNPYPLENVSSNQRDTSVKKLLQIKINGISKIDFNYEKGRLDDNFQQRDSSYVFKGIIIKDWKDNQIKKVVLNHDYSTTTQQRMILKKVSFQNFIDSNKEDYELFYKANLNPASGVSYINKDYWGYFNLRPIIDLVPGLYREVSPEFITSEVIQKMTLPSGGCIIFDFESNTYSYIGSQVLTNFDANSNNWDYHTQPISFNTAPLNNRSNTTLFFTINDKQDIAFNFDVNTTFTNTFVDYFFTLYKVTGSGNVNVGGFACLSCDTYEGVFNVKNLEPGTYKVSFSSPDNSLQSHLVNSNITAFYKTRNLNNYQFLYGGGIRIKNIGYFKDGLTSQTFYENYTSTLPEKEKVFEYNEFDNFLKSSGSLTFDVPRYEYQKFKNECIYCQGYAGLVLWKEDGTGFNYNVVTSFNNLHPVKTQGADVGYKNVKTFEKNNGYVKYEYTSPIDFPESIGPDNLTTPFMPTENYDYKRGLLKSEKTYNASDKILSESNFVYEMQNYMETTGIKTFYYDDFVNIYNYTYYNDYMNYINTCKQSELFPDATTTCNSNFLTGNDCDCFCYFGRPRDFVMRRFIREAYGWAKLASKNTKNYFYPNGSTTPNIVKSNETFTYNSLNKQIASHTVDNSVGDILTTNYFYHTGNSTFSQNRISEIERIETKRGTDLLSESKINYSNAFAGNQSYLPSTIEVKKGSSPSEVRLKNNVYDEFGHVLEVQQENGIKISYIYGYNKSQPIAKLENVAYSSISASVISNLQSFSNTGTETDLIAALNTLRDTFPNAMITTITYKPLIGISTVTDPKGDKITYHYDSFNRLEFVKDKNENILSENKYHYKN